MKYGKILIFLVLICIYVKSFAFDITSLGPINSSVIDTTSTLSSQEKNEIENKINELRNKYTTEILTIIISTTSGEEIGSVATEIGQKVGVGKADKDNGVVILIAKDDRAWNIATGYGVEGVLPDLLTKKIGENNFILFREGKFKDGIIGVLNDFDKAFSGDTSIISLSNNQNDSSEQKNIGLIFILLFIEFPLTILISQKFFKPMVKKGEKKKFFLHYFFPIVGIHLLITLFIPLFLIVTIWVAILLLAGTFGENSKGGGSGRGGWSSSGGGRSSGGSSFGGGSFGGGGSSGKW